MPHYQENNTNVRYSAIKKLHLQICRQALLSPLGSSPEAGESRWGMMILRWMDDNGWQRMTEVLGCAKWQCPSTSLKNLINATNNSQRQ